MMMFYIGRLEYSKKHETDQLLPMPLLRANKEVAMRMGSAASLWVVGKQHAVPYVDLIDGEIDLSRRGLVELGVEEVCLTLIMERLKSRSRHSPIDGLRDSVVARRRSGESEADALRSAIRDAKLLVGMK